MMVSKQEIVNLLNVTNQYQSTKPLKGGIPMSPIYGCMS